MSVNQTFYGTVVLGGTGTVYQIHEVANGFDHYCRVWLVGSRFEIARHMASHGVAAVTS